MIFDLRFECRAKNEGDITAFFSSNFARQITLGIELGLWTVDCLLWRTKRFWNYLQPQNLVPERFVYFLIKALDEVYSKQSRSYDSSI